MSFSTVKYKRCSKVDAVRSWRFQHGLFLLGLMSLRSCYSRITFSIVAYQSFPQRTPRRGPPAKHLIYSASPSISPTSLTPATVRNLFTAKSAHVPRPSSPTHCRREGRNRNSSTHQRQSSAPSSTSSARYPQTSARSLPGPSTAQGVSPTSTHSNLSSREMDRWDWPGARLTTFFNHALSFKNSILAGG